MTMFVLLRAYLPELLSAAQKYIPGYIAPEENIGDSFYRWFFYFSPYTRVFEFSWDA
jgi:hypothetical protein